MYNIEAFSDMGCSELYEKQLTNIQGLPYNNKSRAYNEYPTYIYTEIFKFKEEPMPVEFGFLQGK
jgi:hypothetical protein